VRDFGGYGRVWSERPVRRLLVASLAGRVAFSMLPLGLVLFASAETGSTATAGALIAAFGVASAAAPVRGRIVDRRGPPALIGFGAVCAAGLVALYAAGEANAPAAALCAIGGVVGAAVPPLGAYTRAVWGEALRGRGEQLQRTYALDAAGEEATLIVAPLMVAGIVAADSAGAAVLVAAGGLLAGTIASARTSLVTGESARGRAQDAAAPRARLPAPLWLVIASLAGPGAALGTINVAVPALTRSAGAPASAGLLLAALGAGTAVASLVAGRVTWRRPPLVRLRVLQLVLAGTLAAAALSANEPVMVGAVLVVAGMALGALFVTLYMLVDELTPRGAATRTFAWLVTANNGGLAFGAALAGIVIAARDSAAALWFGVAFALVGMAISIAAGAASE
jgi:predicted MFS family arabinose efflux permease